MNQDQEKSNHPYDPMEEPAVEKSKARAALDHPRDKSRVAEEGELPEGVPPHRHADEWRPSDAADDPSTGYQGKALPGEGGQKKSGADE